MAALSTGIVSGDRQRDPAALDERVRRIAGGLQKAGIEPGDCAAILMHNDIAFMEATYAIMSLGAYAVPINWHFKPEEVAYVLADCGAKAVIGHADLMRSIDPGKRLALSVDPPAEVRKALNLAPDTCIRPGSCRDFEAWLAEQLPYDGPARPQPQSMIYTSGTTGHPKGVRRAAPSEHEKTRSEELRALVYGLRPGVRVLLPGPLYHSAPNSFGIRSGRLGGVLVLMPRFDPEECLRLIEAEKIDTMFMVPTMFVRLLKLPADVRQRYDTSSLRHIIHAAAPCPADVKAAMIEWWGPIIHEFYGGTETGPVTFANSADAKLKPGTVGRAVPGARIAIVDDAGKELPTGGIGEIFCRIEGYPDFTYHNNPDKRRDVERNGLITCGDVGYLDADGYLFICDRKRDMIISGGVNIYPAEIESVLIGLDGVHDCAVFGIPHPEFGESVIAVVEPRPGADINGDSLRAELAKHLADYKVPRRIDIQQNLPREDSGKIFKRRLRDPYWADAGRRI